MERGIFHCHKTLPIQWGRKNHQKHGEGNYHRIILTQINSESIDRIVSICNYIDENNSNLAKVKSFFFQVRPVGRAGRGLLYALFTIHSYRGTLKFRELIPGKTLHSSGTMVRFFCTVPPGSHLHYFHYLSTLYLPSICSIYTLPLSYGKFMGGLR